jgi:hypothetical protein
MDIFDRIAAALELVAAGKNSTDPVVLEHLTAIDNHLSEDDTHNEAVDAHLGNLDGDDAEEKARISVVEAGLTKIADAVAPVATPAPTPAPVPEPGPAPAPAAGDGTVTTAPAPTPVVPSGTVVG